MIRIGGSVGFQAVVEKKKGKSRKNRERQEMEVENKDERGWCKN